MNRKAKIGLFAISIILFMTGCSDVEVPQDNFYVNKGGFGEMRFPLIEPFYMFCYDGQNWILEGVMESVAYNDYNGNCGDIFGIKRLKVFENLFLFRSYGDKENILNGRIHTKESWFILDIKNKIAEGYIDYKTFNDTLYSRYQITTDTLSWRTPRSYYEEFKKKRLMP